VSRLPLLREDQLDEAQRAIYDGIAKGPRASGPQRFRLRHDDGSLTGPFNALLFAPRVGAALSGVGEAIRYGSGLSARLRELAILAVAAAKRADFEWYAHDPIARAAGIDDAVIAEIKAGGTPILDDPTEAAGMALVAALVAGERVGDSLFARAEAALGTDGVVELTALVGYYLTLALLLDVVDVGVPEGDPPFGP
jgi:AhpD family alkylhydroperoxidase